MAVMTPEKERELKHGIGKSDENAFSELFLLLYTDLVLFAGRYELPKEACEDIVQGVFTKLWADRKNIGQIASLRPFLMQAVKNSCLDQLRHRAIRHRHTDYALSAPRLDDLSTYEYVLYSELKNRLDEALNEVPEDCRRAFELNRFSAMSYKEIAEKFHVSERTIEVRIGKALSILRGLLKDYFVVWMFFLLKN